MLDMFDILELPKEESKGIEQFTPLEQAEEQNETISKQDYNSLVKTVEEIKKLLTTNKE